MSPSTKIVEPLEVKERPQREMFGVRLTSVWLWSIVAVGAALRLVALGRKSFWLDEIASVWTARLPGPDFWSVLWHSEGNMALYYLLLRSWLHLGVGEAIVRTLSAIIGIASIPVMYALANRLFGERTARLATLFFALNGCAIAVSQEARGYSLLVLGVVASTYLFVRLVERPAMELAFAYGAVTGLTLYCHYFGMLVPAAQAVSLFALPPEKRPWKQMVLPACVIALAAIPVLWMIHIQDIGHIAWVQKPSWLELYHLGVYLAAGGGKAVGAILLLVELSLLALFLRKLKVLWPERERDLGCWRYSLVAGCLFTPAFISLLVSIVRPIFYHRFLIISLPAWVLMTALGAEEIRSRSWRWACIACVCALSLVSAIASYQRVQEDWRGVTSYLMEQARPEDRVLYYRGVGYFAAEHYRDWLPSGSALRPQGIRVEAVDSDWQKEIDGAARVWLVLYRAKRDDPPSRAIDASLRNRYKVVQEVPFRAVTVVEYAEK
ncbi:MAG TPA: glycosyltransferase family 39 protein [Terriglobales bacterium]|nr:glycosyltransferase family 39 protein [Terriglobales bacterium]